MANALKRVDNEKSGRMECSNFLDLKSNAEELLELMKASFDLELYYQVNHMGHMAIELAMKSVYSKHNCSMHPYGHDLSEIAIYCYLPTKSISVDIRQNSQINVPYLFIKSAWNMQKRYMRVLVEKSDAAIYKQYYLEVTEWILKNYL